jgi:cellulose synthase/poly-beta-1,6-N-acetylglucosamine synthase-like glycosyltransferase
VAQSLDLVTVLVPARNEEASLAACLESILTQDYRELQVVVVDGQSTDGTLQLVHEVMRRDARVEIVTDARRSIPTALNTGLAAARGRWLVRVDGHSTIPAGYVRRAVERISEGTWGAVGGRKDGVGRTPAGRAIAAVMASRLGVGNSTYHHGTSETTVDHVPFGVYPVALLREVGGWDERLAANEDYELDYRLRLAGHQLLFDPQLAIAWESRQSVRDLLRQYHRYGKGKADVAVLHPASLSLRHLLPPAFVAYLAAASAVSVRRPAVAASMVAPYAAALAVGSAAVARRLEPGERRHVVPAYLAMHLGWGAGFLTRLPGAVSGLRRPTSAGRTEPDQTQEAEVA